MKIFLNIIFGILISACSVMRPRSISSELTMDDVLLVHQVSTEKISQVSAENLRRDIDRILLTLENAYPGKDILPKAMYTKLIQVLEKMKATLHDMSSDEFCDSLSSLFSDVNDFHLTVNIENRTCGRSWPRGNVGKNIASGDKNKTWSSFSKVTKGTKVSVLAIRSMSPDSSVDWIGFLDKVKELVESKQSFVIDLRGNGGGSTTNAFEMSRILYGLDRQDQIPWPSKKADRIITSTAYALTANYYWITSQMFEKKGQAVPPHLVKGYREFAKLSIAARGDHERKVETKNLGQVPVNLEKLVQVPIYLLIDKGCGSTCELVVESLEKHPFVRTVGEQTTGVVQFGFVGWLYLPGSHLTIHIPTQGNQYADFRQIEKIGYAPEHLVSPGKDALDFTLENFF